MFTGIIEEVGTVIAVEKKTNSARITIKAERVLTDVADGDSIAVSGVCLTVTSHKSDSFTADVMHETMRRSAIRVLKVQNQVNLERAMRPDGRFGGHLVSGHIDGTGCIEKVVRDEIAVLYTIATEQKLMRYIIEKGSVAVDGISLTVASVQGQSFAVSVIPHTAANTTLSQKKVGDIVNLENDCIGKYVSHFLQADRADGLTVDFLRGNGF